MRAFSKTITLNGPSGESTALTGMVDTGAHFTVAPRVLLQRLGVESIRRIPVQFANGDVTQWDLGEVEAELKGAKSPIMVLFGANDATVLIGAHALEAFLLDVDVVEKKLVPKRALLIRG
jgi:aspartyl protease family protein